MSSEGLWGWPLQTTQCDQPPPLSTEGCGRRAAEGREQTRRWDALAWPLDVDRERPPRLQPSARLSEKNCLLMLLGSWENEEFGGGAMPGFWLSSPQLRFGCWFSPACLLLLLCVCWRPSWYCATKAHPRANGKQPTAYRHRQPALAPTGGGCLPSRSASCPPYLSSTVPCRQILPPPPMFVILGSFGRPWCLAPSK